jgi:hypothetical protein
LSAAAVSAYALGSIGIVAFHLAAWRAAGPDDRERSLQGCFSAADFLDMFLLPGGIPPGGNGTMQHILMSGGAAGVAAVQIAHARSAAAPAVPSS